MHYGRTQHWADNDANRKWIYVEQDPTAIGVNRPIDVPLVGDLRGVVPQLVEALRDSPAQPAPDLDTLVKADAEELADSPRIAPVGTHRRSTRRASSSRPPRPSRPKTASWSATAARP